MRDNRIYTVALAAIAVCLAGPGGGAYAQLDPRFTSNDPWYLYEQPVTADSPTQSNPYGDSTEAGINDYYNRYGYHILRMNPVNLAERGTSADVPIFDQFPQNAVNYKIAGPVKIPSWYIYSSLPSSDSSMSTRVFFSEDERMAGFSQSVSLTGGAKFLNIGVSGGYKSTYERGRTTIRSGEETSIFAEKIVTKYWLTLDKRRIQLNPAFSTAVANLGTNLARQGADAKSLAQNFLNNYGTHYPLSILYGGRCYYEEFVSRTTLVNGLSESFQSEFSEGIKSKILTAAFTAGWGSKNENKVTTSDKVGTLRVKTLGGTGTTFDYFDVTSDKTAVPVKLALRPIHELIRVEFFPAITPASLSRVREALSTQINVIQNTAPPTINRPFDVIEVEIEKLRVLKTGSKGKLPICGDLNWGFSRPQPNGSYSIGLNGSPGPEGDSTKAGFHFVWRYLEVGDSLPVKVENDATAQLTLPTKLKTSLQMPKRLTLIQGSRDQRDELILGPGPYVYYVRYKTKAPNIWPVLGINPEQFTPKGVTDNYDPNKFRGPVEMDDSGKSVIYYPFFATQPSWQGPLPLSDLTVKGGDDFRQEIQLTSQLTGTVLGVNLHFYRPISSAGAIGDFPFLQQTAVYKK